MTGDITTTEGRASQKLTNVLEQLVNLRKGQSTGHVTAPSYAAASALLDTITLGNTMKTQKPPSIVRNELYSPLVDITGFNLPPKLPIHTPLAAKGDPGLSDKTAPRSSLSVLDSINQAKSSASDSGSSRDSLGRRLDSQPDQKENLAVLLFGGDVNMSLPSRETSKEDFNIDQVDSAYIDRAFQEEELIAKNQVECAESKRGTVIETESDKVKDPKHQNEDDSADVSHTTHISFEKDDQEVFSDVYEEDQTKPILDDPILIENEPLKSNQASVTPPYPNDDLVYNNENPIHQKTECHSPSAYIPNDQPSTKETADDHDSHTKSSMQVDGMEEQENQEPMEADGDEEEEEEEIEQDHDDDEEEDQDMDNAEELDEEDEEEELDEEEDQGNQETEGESNSSSEEELDKDTQEEIEDFEKAFPPLKQHYKILSKIGEGTFSSVYKAIDLYHYKYTNVWCKNHVKKSHNPVLSSSSRKRKYDATTSQPCGLVAIKRIYGTSSPQRIYTELAFLQRLCHRNVVSLIAAERYKDQIIAILPYFEHIDFREVKRYMKELMSALNHVHEHRIIHRDIKPGNFLYDRRTGNGVLVDFGLAQDELDPDDPKLVKLRAVTSKSRKPTAGKPPGYIVNDRRPMIRADRQGTRGFRAPEVLFKCVYQTTAIDNWSAGCILLSLLTGQYPFFQAPDDTDALLEVAHIFGLENMKNVAKQFGRSFETNIPTIGNQIPFEDIVKRFGRWKEEQVPPEAYDFLSRLLTLSPTERMKASEALQHPFLNQNL